MPTHRQTSRLPVSAAAAFAWHERPGAFERLVPPWQPVEVLEPPASLRDGARAVLRVPLGPLRRRWVAEHRDCPAGRRFRDVQVSGPFARWEQTHQRVKPARPSASGHAFLQVDLEGALRRLLGRLRLADASTEACRARPA